DPVWERSFPEVGGVALPFHDHTTGRFVSVRLTDREAAWMREENERRAADLLARFRTLDLGPVLVTTSDRGDIFQAFLEWAAEPVEGATQFSRSGVLFGDRVRASVQVIVDRKRVDPSRVGFTAHFAPFVGLGTPHVTRADTGRLTRLTYSADLICLTNICLSKDNPEPVHVQFPPARVFYAEKRGGGRHPLTVPVAAAAIR